MHGRSTDDLESADSQQSQHETQSFAQVESSGPSFVDAGESQCNSVLAESRSGSVIDRTEPESTGTLPCGPDASQENHEGSDSLPSPSHLPSRLPPSIEKEINELLEKQGAADISSQDSIEQPLSNEVHTSQRMPFAAPKRPDMVYFLTLQEQRLALAALAAEEQPPGPREPREPSPASPRPSRRPRAEPRYELDAHCCLQEARIASEVAWQFQKGGSSPSATTRESKHARNLPSVPPLQWHEARSWSPLRGLKTPGGTASTWMGSEPPGTAGTASSAASASEEAAVSPRLGSKKGVARPRSGVRPVLIFPIKKDRDGPELRLPENRPRQDAFTQRQRRTNSPKQGRAGRRVRWLPPLRQLSAPQSSVLPDSPRRRARCVAGVAQVDA
ncbi:unnamed protein product [Symbiodinium sp. CCMP2592]|nr:unnamed protein product [Symbiodinium sp. CCMP2592]